MSTAWQQHAQALAASSRDAVRAALATAEPQLARLQDAVQPLLEWAQPHVQQVVSSAAVGLDVATQQWQAHGAPAVQRMAHAASEQLQVRKPATGRCRSAADAPLRLLLLCPEPACMAPPCHVAAPQHAVCCPAVFCPCSRLRPGRMRPSVACNHGRLQACRCAPRSCCYSACR